MSKTKKVEAKPIPKSPKHKKEKVSKVIKQEARVELVTFSIKATIPTQQYGNFQPEIVVKAPTIEMARDTVMPIIEDLYQTYAEDALNGKTPKFFNKAKVVVTEKTVIEGQNGTTSVPGLTKESVQVPTKTPEVAKDIPNYNEETLSFDKSYPEINKNPAFLKAENAITSAVGIEALDLIEEQIQKSVKINPSDKPVLLTILLKKKATLK